MSFLRKLASAKQDRNPEKHWIPPYQVRGRLSKAPRPKGQGFPERWFHHIVPLDPVLKDGACGALSGQNIFRN